MVRSVSLEIDPILRLADAEPTREEEVGLEQTEALNRFLAGIERRAFRIAVVSVRDEDDALDIVQGAMFRLVRSYGKRPSEQWRPLFYRILYNGIRDWQRRRAVRSRIFQRRTSVRRDDGDFPADSHELAADGGPGPGELAISGEAMERLEEVLRALPRRQQQAFVLRCLEGLDVAETAAVMKCSGGSVKTHYFRALGKLREQLGEVW